ncbi:Oidioi.mRNA.OKI2018_I69.PAR.g8453.t1.cds [Oikopleura dioica]|uniref:Oidioi.mRNA.OKI2018_I69.PAR.g8453.t1.cds n=1 Tax=Oikopleura dioica TaxID=34765 RepID=A0ABN7RFZ8_OIKDI|nr:Oidioi.mRNA.OKI2018_I69.PAR.g8453.t1.cds [Oikopleura dioica]
MDELQKLAEKQKIKINNQRMHINSLQKKLKKIEEKDRADKEGADQSKAKIEELTKMLESRMTRIRYQSKMYIELEKKQRETIDELKEKNSEVLDLKEKLKSSEENSKMKTQMIDSLNEKMKVQQDSVEKLQKQKEEEASRDQHSIKNKNSIISGLRRALKDEKESKKVLKEHLAHVKSLLSESNKCKVESEKKIENLQNQLEENSRAAKYKETIIEAEHASLKEEMQLLKRQNEEKFLEINKTNQRLHKKFDNARAKLQKMEEAERATAHLKYKRKETEIEAENAILKKGVQILKEKQHEQTAIEENLKRQLSESQNEKKTLKAKLADQEKKETLKKAESKARRVLSFQKQELVELKSQVEHQTTEIDELKSKVQELKMENEKLTGLAGKSERKLRMKIMKIAKICEE